jgi:hypothetical protein
LARRCQNDRSRPVQRSVSSRFDWVSGIDGTFAKLEIPAGSQWDMIRLYDTGEVTLLAVNAAGPGYVPFLQSDLNADADVDTADLLTLLAGWTGAEAMDPSITPAMGDTDGDMEIDTADQLFMLSQWTGAQGAGRVTAVPEPVSEIAELAVMALMTIRQRPAEKLSAKNK